MKSISKLLLLVFTFIVCSCSSGDEIWILKIGESRNNVVKQLKDKGYDIENFSDDSYVSINEKVKYNGIEWNAVTCWFDKHNKLKSIDFTSYYPLTSFQIENLLKHLKEEGYPELEEDPRCEGFYLSDKLPMTVMLNIPTYGYGHTKLNYCKDAHKVSN